jgi:hypothetical protein
MKTTINFKIGFLAFAMLAAVNAGWSQQTNFAQITDGDIVNDQGIWIGCAWGDFHNSGFLDLVVANLFGTNAYYENNNGMFIKISQGDPVQDADYGVGALAADYDNDGNLDLAFTSGAFYSLSHNRLYHGNGDGTFSQASGGVVTNLAAYFGPGAWGDYDNDGFVDLLVLNHGTANANGGPNVLYHNNGDGTFTRVTSGAIVNDFISVGFCATWEDYDNDGFLDLLVINYASGNNILYHNNRNGTFGRVSTNIVATDYWPGGASCAAWGDYDNDGLPDLFVTDGAGSRNQLYHNGGNGSFTRVTSGPELVPSPGGASNGCGWGDYDNDGYLDLFVSGNDETNAMFHNNGDGTFTKITSGAPVEEGGPHMVCGAVSWVDYDQDGFLDLFVGRVDATNESSAFLPGKNLLYHNNGNTNAWLEIKLTGTVSNRSAIGAKVRVHATIGGKTFWQLREIGNGGGYNCQPLVAHFGLGDATNVDIVRIEWPSGLVQEFQNVAPKQILTYTEPPRLLATTTGGVPQFSLKGGRGFQYEIDSSPDLSAWSSIGTLTVTNLNGMASIVDTNPPASNQRFYRAIAN